MIGTVNLNHKFLFFCQKIDNIITNHVLSQKLHPKVIFTEMLPQDIFGQSSILSVLQCILMQQVITVRRCRFKICHDLEK